jgi:hypothetical protein
MLCLGGIPDLSLSVGCFELGAVSLWVLSCVWVWPGGFLRLAMSIGGSKVFEAAFRLLWRFLSGMGCGFRPGSKVSAEAISFL